MSQDTCECGPVHLWMTTTYHNIKSLDTPEQPQLVSVGICLSEDHRYRITEEFEVEVLALDQPATFGLCDLERVTDMLSASVWSPRN